MRVLQNVAKVAVVAALVFGVTLVANNNSAEARPKYRDAASEMYPDLVKKYGKDGKFTCALCHPSTEKSKKKRNDYGVAISKHLPKTNETDADKIKEALKKTEDDKNADDVTYKSKIDAGELPGKDEAAN